MARKRYARRSTGRSRSTRRAPVRRRSGGSRSRGPARASGGVLRIVIENQAPSPALMPQVLPQQVGQVRAARKSRF